VETAVDLLEVPIPAAGYYAGASLNVDASNHFGPNPLAVEAMLRDAGFSRITAFRRGPSARSGASRAPTNVVHCGSEEHGGCVACAAAGWSFMPTLSSLTYRC